jgi:predicted GTPase
MARQAGDVLIWDGGNNDTPFFRSNLEIVLVDPLRAGDELSFYPGFVNFLRAHVVVIGKSSGVPHEQLEHIHRNLRKFVPETPVVQGDLVVSVKTPEMVSGRRVLVVEDGPTVSHGGMAFGAGVVAARRFGAAEIVDPRPFAAGSLAQVYDDFPHLGAILPAMGYSRAQLHDLEETIEAVPCDLVLSATPVDLRELLDISKPVVPVAYEFCECGPDALMEKVMEVLVEYEKNDAIGFTGT